MQKKNHYFDSGSFACGGGADHVGDLLFAFGRFRLAGCAKPVLGALVLDALQALGAHIHELVSAERAELLGRPLVLHLGDVLGAQVVRADFDARVPHALRLSS